MIFTTLVWYGLRFLNNMSLIEPSRSEVIAWNLADFGALSFMFLAVAWSRLKEERVFSLRTSGDRRGFVLLGIWLACMVLSFARGLARGNSWDYAIGDLYRFAVFPVAVTLVYFVGKDTAGLHRLLCGFVAVYGLATSWDLVRFNSYLSAMVDGRLTTETAHQVGMIAPAILWVILFGRKRWAPWLGGVVSFLVAILLFRAQMLTPLLTTLAALVLFFLFSRRFTALLASAGAAALLVGTSLYAYTVSPDAPSYIADKLDAAASSADPLESVQALSGVRSGEIIAITDDLWSHPTHLLFGAGEGTLVDPDPVVPIERLLTEKHYVHAGLFDALYHNGAIAVGAFLLFMADLARQGLRLHSAGNSFGQFVIAVLFVILVLLSYDMPFESAVPFVALCWCGISIYRSAPAARAGVPAIRSQPGLAMTRERA